MEAHEPPLVYTPSPDCDCKGNCVTCAEVGCADCFAFNSYLNGRDN